MLKRALRLCGLVALSLASATCAFAQHDADPKDHKHEHGKHEPVKYRVSYHDAEHHHQEKVLDSNSEDLKKLIAEGHVEHLEVDKPIINVADALRWDLGLWAVVVFLLLFFILSKVAWGPMLEGLQKREQTIRAAVEEAKEARKETERISTEFKTKMEAAYAEIPKMMEEARRDAQNMAEEMRTKAQADILTERQRLRREIETARDQALQELWSKAAELATLISAKAIRRSLSEDDHRRLLDEALTELRTRERRIA